MEIKIVNKSNYDLPEYKTIGSSGVDIKANIEKEIKLNPLERIHIPTGLYISLPVGVEAQIRARSGLSIKHGITCVNGIGTIDSDYRGEIGVLLINLSNETYTINPGDRIAQMVFVKYERADFEVVDDLDETDRSSGGFGSTGY